MRLGSARTHSSVAPALVLPYPALERAGLRVRRGQTSLTVAAPGVGKSQLWQNIAHRMLVPTLYWSADTDQGDVTVRTLALQVGQSAGEIEKNLADPAWRSWLFDRLEGRADHIEWVFDSPITGRGLGERMKAFATVRGEYPHLTVLDNMSNAIEDPSNEYSEVKKMLSQVQVLARETHSHIAVLHHAKGAYDSGTVPIPQSGGLQNPFKVPEIGLTLCRVGADGMDVYVVKNRGGKSDPAATSPIQLRTDFDRGSVLGFTERGAA